MIKHKFYSFLLCLITIHIFVELPCFSQENGKIVTLVVSGEGTTKEEATKKALRSATDQAFGTFVSANTMVLNDEIVKDEIVTVNQGVIQSYKEISCIDSNNGIKIVTIQAVVSIGKLVTYAQNKGMETELAGATYAMNKKMRALNKKNEKDAYNHLMEELECLSQKGLFDFTLETSDPYNDDGKNRIDIVVKCRLNDNGKAFFAHYKKTIFAIALSETEKAEYESANEKYYGYRDIENYQERKEQPCVYMRNQYNPTLCCNANHSISLGTICHFLNQSITSFVVQDNLGNKGRIVFIKDYGITYKKNINSRGWIFYNRIDKYRLEDYSDSFMSLNLTGNWKPEYWTKNDKLYLDWIGDDPMNKIILNPYQNSLKYSLFSVDRTRNKSELDFAYGSIVKSFNFSIWYTDESLMQLSGFTVKPVPISENNHIEMSKEEEALYKFPFVDLGLPSGTLWAQMNLGATNILQAGDLYAWGDMTPNKKEFTKENYSRDVTDFCSAIFGKSWKLPSKEQVKELLDCCKRTLEIIDGVCVWRFTGEKGKCIYFSVLPIIGIDNSNSKCTGYWLSDEINTERHETIYFTKEKIGYAKAPDFFGLCIRPVIISKK